MPDEGKAAERDDDREIKVTDKRMFTPDGRLRDEYRFLDDAQATPSGSEAPADGSADDPPGRGEPAPGQAAPDDRPGSGPTAAAPSGAAPSAATRSPSPDESPKIPPERPRRPDLPEFSGPQSVGVLDLVAMLAESAAVYLGDAELPDGSSGEQLDMARVHIDLLEVLRQKTAGNLSAQESAVLEDVLYRLRVRYVQKRG